MCEATHSGCSLLPEQKRTDPFCSVSGCLLPHSQVLRCLHRFQEPSDDARMLKNSPPRIPPTSFCSLITPNRWPLYSKLDGSITYPKQDMDSVRLKTRWRSLLLKVLEGPWRSCMFKFIGCATMDHPETAHHRQDGHTGG